MKYTFGQKLSNLLKLKGVNVLKASKKAGIPNSTLYSFIKERNHNPKTTTLIKLSKYFKISLDELTKDVIFKVDSPL